MPVQLPAGVRDFASRGPGWAAFVDRLPGLVTALLAEWELVPEGAATHGHCALVQPVRSDAGPAVLKIGYPDEESEHEGLALQRWGGRGAVRLLRADPHRRALLLERLDRTDLADVWDVAACEVVGGLYRQLHVPAPPQLRTLSSYVARRAEELAALPRSTPLPHRLVEQAASLAHGLAADPATDGTLVHTDLHYANVLAGTRADWLAIDPKPLSGDPHHEPAPLLWNRWDEVVDGGDVRGTLRRRFHAVVDAAGLDEDRARDWVVVRMLCNALDHLQDAADGRRATSERLTVCISVAKAVQD